LHFLTLLQALETARLDRRGVHKNIVAIPAADEPWLLALLNHSTVPCPAILNTGFPFN
jgi:hypothetical protein